MPSGHGTRTAGYAGYVDVSAAEDGGKDRCLSEHEDGPDQQAEHSCEHGHRGVDGEVLGGLEEPEGRAQRDQRVRGQQPSDEHHQDKNAGEDTACPSHGQKDENLRGGLGTDPVDHAHAERGELPVVHECLVGLRTGMVMVPATPVMAVVPHRGVFGVDAFVRPDENSREMPVRILAPCCRWELSPSLSAGRPPGPNPPHALANAREDQHPSAAEPEVPSMSDQRDEHVDAEKQQCHSYHPGHGHVHALRKLLAYHDGDQPQHEDDQGMPECVQRPEHDRLSTFFLRAGDVGDCSYVVPVDPVAKSEQGGGDQDSEPESLLGDVGEDGDHSGVVASFASLSGSNSSTYRNELQKTGHATSPDVTRFLGYSGRSLSCFWHSEQTPEMAKWVRSGRKP